MHSAIVALLEDKSTVDTAQWEQLLGRVRTGELEHEQAIVLLASLSTRLPAAGTLANLVSALRGKTPPTSPCWRNTVNIVGTGGGPATFNISTAAAFAAAAAGVTVVKTGSRAYTSSLGSVDLLHQLGIRQTCSLRDTEKTLRQFGIAFAGAFAYPPELAGLARLAYPLPMHHFGRFLNAIGPFIARLPVTAQVTGVSARYPLDDLRELATTQHDRRIWLCSNDLGADELLGFAANTIWSTEGTSTSIPAQCRSEGALAELLPAPDANAVEYFLTVLGGKGGTTATRAVCLNGAALALAAGHAGHWPQALELVSDAVYAGRARELAERMCTSEQKEVTSHG